MGHITGFRGRFSLDRPLTEAQAAYLIRFAKTRRMMRSPIMLTDAPDPWRTAVGLPLGTEAEYYNYTGGEDDRTWSLDSEPPEDPSVVEDSEPPSTQPGLWCDWVPTADRMGIEWNGREKFYTPDNWLHCIIENFLTPWGCILSGRIAYQGQDSCDYGFLCSDGDTIRDIRYDSDADPLAN